MASITASNAGRLPWMSETIATRITTVSLVKAAHGVKVLWPTLAAVAAAEAGRRLLAPRTSPVEPVRVDLRAHFSEQEIDRGRRYARPQLALGLARGAIDLAGLAVLTARPPGMLARLARRPVAGGAVAAVGLSLGLSAASLPLRALSRRRSMAVGLDTQSWGAWAGDLAKAAAIQTAFGAGAGAGVIALSRRYPRGWWAPVALGA